MLEEAYDDLLEQPVISRMLCSADTSHGHSAASGGPYPLCIGKEYHDATRLTQRHCDGALASAWIDCDASVLESAFELAAVQTISCNDKRRAMAL